MSAAKAGQTAVALITAAGLDDNAETFTAILGDLTVQEAAEVILALVGGYRGTLRAVASKFGIDGDDLIDTTLAGVGQAWAEYPS